jgi:hypothetical protein
MGEQDAQFGALRFGLRVAGSVPPSDLERPSAALFICLASYMFQVF